MYGQNVPYEIPHNILLLYIEIYDFSQNHIFQCTGKIYWVEFQRKKI